MAITTEASIWERVIWPAGKKMSPATARAILRLSLRRSDRDRLHKLARKSKAGRLSGTEAAELDEYCRAGRLLSILKSKARKALKNCEP